MKIKRIRLSLPAHMAGTATHDARAIAEAIGKAVAEGKRPDSVINVQSHGQRGAVLASQVTSSLKGGSGNGR